MLCVLAGAYNGCVGVVVYIIPLFVLWTPLDLPAFRTRGPHLLPKTRFFIFESFDLTLFSCLNTFASAPARALSIGQGSCRVVRWLQP